MSAFFSRQLRRGIRRALILAIVIIVASLAACGGGGESLNNNKRIKAVTTLPLFADFVRNIGGDRVEVTALLPTGSDPHTWEPAPSDARRVAEADIAFANGLDLEPGASKLIESNLAFGAPYAKLGERAKEAGVPQIDENPHLWLDIGSAQVYVTTVVSELKSIDPNDASVFEQNLNRFISELRQTDEYINGKIGTIPEPNRKLVTTHDAFPYLAEYLKLDIVAFAEESPGQESGPGAIADLAEALRAQHLPAVFSEPQVTAANKVLEQAAADAGVQVCTLYSDSLDDRVTNYIQLMRFDADELARCLGGKQ